MDNQLRYFCVKIRNASGKRPLGNSMGTPFVIFNNVCSIRSKIIERSACSHNSLKALFYKPEGCEFDTR
jgi:hypothetical protein